MNRLYTLGPLAFLMALGVMLNILACALFGSWWPMIVFVGYVIVPPLALMGLYRRKRYNNVLIDARMFSLTSVSFVCTVCVLMHLLLWHAQITVWQATLLNMIGTPLVFIAIICFTYLFTDGKPQHQYQLVPRTK